MKTIKNAASAADYNIYYHKMFSVSYHYDDVVYSDKSIISLNKVFHDSELEALEDYIKNLVDKEFFGIIFSDLALYTIAKKYKLENKLIYDPNTLITNYEDFNFWSDYHILGVFASPFITIEDLKKIGQEKKLKLFFQGYGHLNMFYSHRKLISNFYEFNNEDSSPYLNKILYLKEETRDEVYPIIETNGEVIIYSPYVFSCLDYLDELNDYIDYLYIDDALNDSSATDGFLHKKTVYRR